MVGLWYLKVQLSMTSAEPAVCILTCQYVSLEVFASCELSTTICTEDHGYRAERSARVHEKFHWYCPRH
jgi:hypothetical protein